MALLHLIFQFPSNTYNGYPRNLAAFYQHYFVNLFFQHKATEYDWIYWKDMYKTVFGNSQSIFDIIFHYPKEFFSHILYNIKNYTIEIFTKNLAIISPYLFGMNKMYFAGSVSVFLFSIVLLFFKNIRQSFTIIKITGIFFNYANDLGVAYFHFIYRYFSARALYFAKLLFVYCSFGFAL